MGSDRHFIDRIPAERGDVEGIGKIEGKPIVVPFGSLSKPA